MLHNNSQSNKKKSISEIESNLNQQSKIPTYKALLSIEQSSGRHFSLFQLPISHSFQIQNLMVLQQAFGYKRYMLEVKKVDLKESILFLQHLGVIRFVAPFIRAGLTQLDILTWKAQ